MLGLLLAVIVCAALALTGHTTLAIIAGAIFLGPLLLALFTLRLAVRLLRRTAKELGKLL